MTLFGDKALRATERAVGPTGGRLAAAARVPDPLGICFVDNFTAGFNVPDVYAVTDAGPGGSNGGAQVGGSPPMLVLTGDVIDGGWTIVDWGRQSLRGFAYATRLSARISLLPNPLTSPKLFVGLARSTERGSVADGIFIGMDAAVSSTYCVAVARNGGVATTRVLNGDGGYARWPIVYDEWHDVDILCDPIDNKVLYYVDGDLAAEIGVDEDVPDDPSDNFTLHFSAEGAAGASTAQIRCRVILVEENP